MRGQRVTYGFDDTGDLKKADGRLKDGKKLAEKEKRRAERGQVPPTVEVLDVKVGSSLSASAKENYFEKYGSESKEAGEEDFERIRKDPLQSHNLVARLSSGKFKKSHKITLFQAAPATDAGVNPSDYHDGISSIVTNTSVAHLKKQDGYESAKLNGDTEAAMRIAEGLIKDSVVNEIKNKLDPNKPVVVVPVFQVEGEVGNRSFATR